MDELESVFCKTKFGSDHISYTKFTKTGDAWEYTDFLLALGIKYNISVYDIEYLADSCGVKIPQEYFIDIFYQNYNHPEFVLTFGKNTNNTVKSAKVMKQNCRIGYDMYITSEELEQFISESQNAHVLRKKYNPDKPENILDLSDIERRAVIREAVNLLVQKFTYHPTPEHKLAISHAVTQLFPTLKTQNSKTEGLELLYNREDNRGYIVNRLSHIRSKLYKTEGDSFTISTNTETTKKRLTVIEKEKYKKQKIEEEPLSYTSNVEENFLILRHLNVITQKENIKQKLKETVAYRKQAIRSSSFPKISEAFPFFFVSPDLILFDYELHFPETSSSNFIESWPNVAQHIQTIWRGFKGPSASQILEIDDWLASFQQFFFLLHLLPQTSLGRISSKNKRLTFLESINRLIIFKPLNLTNAELIQPNVKTPYIIAVGENKKAISHFLLCVECDIIPLPLNFDIIQAVDILFKAHYVFNQQFDESLKNFWIFLAHYFFNFNEKLSTKTIDVINKLTISISKQ